VQDLIKNPDTPASRNQGSKSQGTLSEESKAIISRFPISAKPLNTKKLLQFDGRWWTSAELSQYYRNLNQSEQTASTPDCHPFTIPSPIPGVLAQDGLTPSLSLLRNNSNENQPETVKKPPFKALKGLNSHHKKTKTALLENVDYLSNLHGIENIGFLTLTFKDHITDPKEAQRRFNSLATGVLKERYPAYIRVIERQKSGRIHYHLLVVLPNDIRTGFNFDDVKNGNYKSASPHLRREWAFWHKTAPLYGFGRTELLPIKSSGRGLGLYVGKYIAKHVGHREETDKGVRLVTYGGSSRNWTSKHTPLDYPSTQWRYKCETFARQVVRSRGLMCFSLGDMSRIMGKNWAFKHREYIMQLPPTDPSCPF
jgi:hypothetical protein